MNEVIPDEDVIYCTLMTEIAMRHFRGYFEPLGFPTLPTIEDYRKLLDCSDSWPKLFDSMYFGKHCAPAKEYFSDLISEILYSGA